jgi:outer membrane protein
MSRTRPLALALAFALLPATAAAEDLLQTYELARGGDPRFSEVESQSRATREGAVQARAAMLPQISGEASVRRSRSEGPATQNQFDPATGQPVQFTGDIDSEVTTRDIGLNLRQMVYDRSNFTRLEAQRARSRAAEFTVDAAGDDLITRTSAAYFNVLVAIETLAAAEAQQTALRKQLDFADKRLEVGLAPITDVHEARAQFEGARANVVVTRAALADAYQALAEITGTPVRNLKGLPPDFQPQLPPAGGADQWVATALENNPSIRSLGEQVSASEADIKTARAGHLPTVYLSGGYGDTRTTGERTFSSSGLPQAVTSPIDSQSRGPSVGITLSVPIFSGGAVQSQVRQAIAQRDVSADRLEQQRRAVVRNTHNAYQAVVSGVSEVEARRLALVAAQSAYDASQVGFEVGTRTVIDVLLNQQTLFDAQRQYALARYNFLQNRLLLEQQAGTLGIEDLQEINRLLTVNAEAQLSSPPPAP